MEENKNDKKQKNNPILNESILRVSFLEQAASLLTSQNHLAMPTNDLLGRLLLRELREISYVDQLRIHRDLKRSFCKKCFKFWLPDSSRTLACKIKKKFAERLSHICMSCWNEKIFPLNSNYKSRNEKNGVGH